tara:strand:+ start:240 stop:671 length:432 start_codon:yes stop_codon:yes gene_type:complete
MADTMEDLLLVWAYTDPGITIRELNDLQAFEGYNIHWARSCAARLRRYKMLLPGRPAHILPRKEALKREELPKVSSVGLRIFQLLEQDKPTTYAQLRKAIPDKSQHSLEIAVSEITRAFLIYPTNGLVLTNKGNRRVKYLLGK